MLLSLALLAAPAHSEDSTFVTAAPVEAEEEKPVTHLSAEVGGTYTTGNSYLYALSAGLKADHTWTRNMISGNAGVNIGGSKSDDDGDNVLDETERSNAYDEDARKLWAELKYDRYVSDRNSFYILAGAYHDVFSGYDLRAHEQLGYAHLFVKEEKTEFKGEIGFDYAQEDYVDGIDPNFENILAARLLLGLRHAFNENVGFSETFEVYESVLDYEDLRILNTASLTAKLTGTFAVKLSNSLIYDNVPVEDRYAKLDQTTMLTLVASIL